MNREKKEKAILDSLGKNRIYIILGGIVILTVILSVIVISSKKEEVKGQQESKHKEGEILLKFKDEVEKKIKKDPKPKDTGLASIDKLNEKNKVSRIKKTIANAEKISKKGDNQDLEKIYTLEVPQGEDEEALAEEYQADPSIEYAEPNFEVKIGLTPNDPFFSSQGTWGQSYDDLWGLKKIQASSAWDIERGSSDIIVAVIDTGIDYNHEDLVGNRWVNTDEILGNGKDDDHNGYVDDRYGYDFYNNDGDPKDDHGHGSHCAGIIAAVTNNSKGIAGVSWSTQVMSVKFLSSSGSGYLSDAISAIYYAVNNGAKILSNSWGGWGRPSSLQDAINWAVNHGAIFVAAAGNSDDDTYDFSPAGLDNVLTVSATDYRDHKASFSNWGDEVDVAAPGVDILSLRAAGTSMGSAVGDKYTRASGTSMATPHVSGLASLVWAHNPAASRDLVEGIIKNTADDLGSPGFDIYFGYGRINAYGAVSYNLERPNHTLIRVKGSKAIYLLDNGYKKWVPSLAVFKNNFRSLNEVVEISSYEMSQYPAGERVKLRDGTLVRLKGTAPVYVLENGLKRHIVSATIFARLNYSFKDVVSLVDLSDYGEGDPLTETNKHVSGSILKVKGEAPIYQIVAGEKRWIPSWHVFVTNFARYMITAASKTELDSYSLGAEVSPRDGTLMRIKNRAEVYVVENGLRRHIVSAGTFEAYGYKWNNIMSFNSSDVSTLALGDPLSL